MTPRGPRQAAILALYTTPGQYLLAANIVSATGGDPRGTYQCLHWMVGIGMLHCLAAPVGSRLSRYFATAADAEAGRAEFDASRLAIKPSRRPPKPQKPKTAKMTQARKAFNAANTTPKACLPPSRPRADGRGPAYRDGPVSYVDGFQVTICPGFERFESPQAAKWAAA